MTTATSWYSPDPVPGHPVPGMRIWGWMSPAELAWLERTAATMRSVVEVGCLHGRSSTALLGGCPGSVYCIDPWDDPADQSYGSFLGNCGRYTNLRAIRGRSPQAAALVPDVDMVFLDGDHDRDAVAADLAAWLPKTCRLICGHDYNHPGFPGVRQAVDDMFGPAVRPAVGNRWDDGAMSIWTVDVGQAT
jgi:predicted O-methyltransferase YrrM